MLTKFFSVEDNRGIDDDVIEFIEADITNMIPTAEIERGDLVLLESGWLATAYDKHLRGSTPMCKVYGMETEIGSVYAHEIKAVRKDGKWLCVELTRNQLATRKAVTGR